LPSVAAGQAVADNSAALRRARRKDSTSKRQHAADVLSAMEASGKPITFPAVARQAGVSVSLLYADATLTARIAAARDRQRQAGAERAWRLPARSLITEQSLRAELANTKDRARRLTEEVAVLQQRLSRHLGAAADAARGEAVIPLLDQLEQRAAELEADSHRQQQRIIQLEAEIQELTETVAAARAMNRELMSELNRNPDRPPTPRAPRRAKSRSV
jgi:DNA-binding protein H-NS